MNGFLVALMIVMLVLLALVGYAVYSLMNSVSDLYHIVEKDGDYKEIHLRRMGSQLEQVRLDTSSARERSEDLADEVHSITQVMANAKRRGTWGEYQLESIVRTYLGDSPYLYSTQYHLKNGRISDGAFHMPQSDQVLCIDSKFPMENYLRMCEEPESAEYYEKEFRKNIKKHIDDVADKYITEETLDEALLFIPSEAVYAYLCGEGAMLQQYALSRHVLLVSPTTLCGVVFSLQASTRSFYRAANMEAFEKEVRSLEIKATMLCENAGKTCRTSALLQKQLAALQESAEKLLAQISQNADPVFSDDQSFYDFDGED